MRKAVGAALLIVGVGTGACGVATHAVTTPSSNGNSQSNFSSVTTSAPIAHVGSILNFSGQGNSAYSVRLMQIIDPAQGSDQYVTPTPGDRFVAVLFSLTAGAQAVSGDANVNASAIGSNGQTYTADFDSVSECTSFSSGEYRIVAHQSATGCVVFQVPTGISVAKVQWAPSGGYSNGFGQWSVP